MTLHASEIPAITLLHYPISVTTSQYLLFIIARCSDFTQSVHHLEFSCLWEEYNNLPHLKRCNSKVIT